MLATVDVGGLFQVVWGSLAAVLVLSTAFAAMLLGLIRSSETRREGAVAASLGFGLVAVVGLAAFTGAMVYGFTIIIQK